MTQDLPFPPYLNALCCCLIAQERSAAFANLFNLRVPAGFQKLTGAALMKGKISESLCSSRRNADADGAEINVRLGEKTGRLLNTMAPLSFQLVTRKGSGADEGPLRLGRKSVIT